MTVRVTTAAQAAAIDARAIAAGTPSFALMAAAGRAAAQVIRERFADAAARGVTVFAGPGNNGGDGYVVAAALAADGMVCSVRSIGEPRTDDAKRARAEAAAAMRASGAQPRARGEVERSGVVVDALLGTGASGAPRDDMAAAIETINTTRTHGGVVVSLDVPSGVDATTGQTPGAFVRADCTVTFGTIKRGLLRNRDATGAIVAADISLGDAAAHTDGLDLVDVDSLASVPAITADAYKGTRKRLLIIGGAEGMAGATILAARGALRSGIGMVKVCVERPSIAAIQAAEPAALTAAWPTDDQALADQLRWAHVVLLGPGLGLGPASRALAQRVLTEWRGPIVVDADALTMCDGNGDALGNLLNGRPAVITPHVAEAQRLFGVAAADIDSGRFEAAARLADRVRAVVLLKGVPTVVSNGARSVVVATGSPVLATGGSGDVLAGIVATLLAQTCDPFASAATGAWVHGRAAELAGAGQVRGVTLDEVVLALRDAWRPAAPHGAPVIAELARAGEQA